MCFFYLDNKTEVVYNVVNKKALIEASRENQDLIKSNEYLNIVSVGRFTNSHKGFDRLLRIHNKLIAEGLYHKLYIIGDGENRKDLESLIQDDYVILPGFVDNPYKYVKNADLFVCSSYKEGYSTAVTEALILGVPVISTEVSGARKLINNGCGTVCDNDEEALYNAIKQALTNKAFLEEYKQKAIERSEQFSMQKSIEDFEAVINY